MVARGGRSVWHFSDAAVVKLRRVDELGAEASEQRHDGERNGSLDGSRLCRS
jgi:hypothetical protein